MQGAISFAPPFCTDNNLGRRRVVPLLVQRQLVVCNSRTALRRHAYWATSRAPACSADEASPGGVQILHVGEAGDYVAVNKPAGMLVHRNDELAPNDKLFLKDVTRKLLISERGLDVPVYVVHRLDRATSGVILFALGSGERAAALQTSLQNVDETDKQYWTLTRVALDYDMPPSWTNEHSLKDLSKRKSSAPQTAYTSFTRLLALEGVGVDDPQMDTEAEAHKVCVVRAQLRTGRRHQVRRHLANGRFPVLGDTSYGKGRHNREARRLYGAERLALHARRLTFREPDGHGGTGRVVTIEAPVPEDLRQVLAKVPGFNAETHSEMCDLGSCSPD
jgi:tRNA pseudouridine65 synthase